ncbi:MAG: response regulator [Alphaproteobacteria bacterium]
MDTLKVNADKEFRMVISSIAKKPDSWEGWSALHVVLHDDHASVSVGECLGWANSIIRSYLNMVEGRAFFFGTHLHILCKDIAQDILEEVGREICDFFLDEASIVAGYVVYDLFEQADEYYSCSGICDRDEGALYTEHKDVMVEGAFLETVFQQAEAYSADSHNCTLPKVLLVDDDPVARWMVRNALKCECEFATAISAHKAYTMYGAFQPDLVFLDINLPDQKGTEVLGWIMRNDPGARVVMFSSENHVDMISQTLNAGATGFVAKPFLRKNLLQYVRAS